MGYVLKTELDKWMDLVSGLLEECLKNPIYQL